jgi:hypothetical protein
MSRLIFSKIGPQFDGGGWGIARKPLKLHFFNQRTSNLTRF